MKLTYSVSFEFETRAPETLKGTVEATKASTGASRAIRQANRAIHPRHWTSVVCVLEKAAFETDQ